MVAWVETSAAGFDHFVADVPAPALRTALSDAVAGADAGMGVRVLRSVAEEGAAEAAESLIAMLEAADRAEAAIHGLDGGELNTGTNSPNGMAVLATGWLRARAGELAGEIGPPCATRLADTLRSQAAGRVMEAEDLYDAARPAARYLEAARLRPGALLSLAAALGCTPAGGSEEDVDRLAEAGQSLGMAVKIQRDVSGFVSRFVAGAPGTGAAPGGALSNGAYSLPVIRAIEAEPKIASGLGGPVTGEKLLDLVARIKDAGGLTRAAEDCTEHASTARATLEELGRGEALAALADEVAESAEGAAAR
jgi:heptaprenyl diphosphate synthase